MRLLAPEVIQTSTMDCGPAALKALLGGFGIQVSYGRLREACQVGLDGTSIDTVEEVACQLGLVAEQVMVPPEHVLLPAARCLPGIIAVRQPTGSAHFVVAWRRHGTMLQLMDPANGRRWITARSFLEQMYLHRLQVPAAAWRDWAATPEHLEALRDGLARAGVPARQVETRLSTALADSGWRGLAALDAAARLARSLAAAGALPRGRAAARLVASLADPAVAQQRVPEAYWSVWPAPAAAGGERLELRGAVMVRARGLQEPPGASAAAAERRHGALSPELAAALAEPAPRPGRDLLRLIRAGGLSTPLVLAAALVVLGLGGALEALLLRSLLDLGPVLQLAHQRLLAIGSLLVFLTGLLLIELPIAFGTSRLGRQLETRLRLAFLRKLPRLADRYLHSRLVSDMAERGHGAHRLRLTPELGQSAWRAAIELLVAIGGILWIDPGGAPLVLAAATLVLVLPALALPLVAELDLRLRSHAGALSRFYLDAMLGLIAVRSHGAERSVRRQHEALLVDWARAHRRQRAAEAILNALVQAVMLGLCALLLFDHVARRGLDGGVLLLFFWSFNIAAIGHALTLLIANGYPAQRSIALRLLEPLGALEQEGLEGIEGAEAAPPPGGGVALELRRVLVRASGNTLLSDIDLLIAGGEHVAIVGPSGAGKSTLAGVLLGWQRPAPDAIGAAVLADGEPLAGKHLLQLRRATAWVDPAVRLWNRSLLDNLTYGADPGTAMPLASALGQAELADVLRRLPAGLQTPLGEAGGLVSGGEGQRIRLARALLRDGVRLALLDEPFRGLDRGQRRELLDRARRHWQTATLLCITHDMEETLAFPRVLVMEGGRIVEDGPPAELAARLGSRYGALLAAEREVRDELWERATWRRFWLEDGALVERERGGGEEPAS